MDRNGKHCVTSFSMNVRNVYCLKSIIFDHILKVFILYRLYKDGEKMSDEIGVFFNLFFLCTDSQQCTCKKKH